MSRSKEECHSSQAKEAEGKDLPMTLGEWGRKLLREGAIVGEGLESDDLPFYGDFFKIPGQESIYLGIRFNPKIYFNGVLIKSVLFGVGDSKQIGISEEECHSLEEELAIFDIDPESLMDPSFLGMPDLLLPNEILLYPGVNTANKNKSWVVDPELRALINKHSTSNDHERFKYYQLRQAAEGGEVFFDSYEDVVRESRRTTMPHFDAETQGITTKPYVPIYSKADVEWLEEYMRNMGIPIPPIHD